jgi:hypothetical protein
VTYAPPVASAPRDATRDHPLWAADDDRSRVIGTGSFQQVAAETRVYLSERGIDLSGEQQTKTRTALEFFARELAVG